MQLGRLSVRSTRLVWTLALATASMVLVAGPASAIPPDAKNSEPLATPRVATPRESVVDALHASSSPVGAQADAIGRSATAPSVIPQDQAVSKTGKTYGELSAAW